MKLLVITDFDGTLAPIRKNPLSVKISQNTYLVLEKLAKTVQVVILTSRGNGFVEKQVPKTIKVITNRGNKTLPKKQIKKITIAINKEFKKFEVKIEPKQASVALHYRNLNSSSQKLIEIKARKLAKTLNLKIIKARKAFEFTPKNFKDKADVIKNFKFRRIIFFGDDESDAIVAQEVIKKGGVAYLVKTKERNYTPSEVIELNGVKEVKRILNDLANSLEHRYFN